MMFSANKVCQSFGRQKHKSGNLFCGHEFGFKIAMVEKNKGSKRIGCIVNLISLLLYFCWSILSSVLKLQFNPQAVAFVI